MKRLFFIFMIFLISNNILIFFYGIFVQSQYHSRLKIAQENYLLDSALVLAIHDLEDNNSNNINKEHFFKRYKIGYIINKVDDKNIYIKVFYKEKNKIKYREYLKKI